MSALQSDMCSEFRRYATFNGFQTPSGVWPSQLAQAGFYRSGTCGNHQVVCFTCGLQLDVRRLTRQPVMEVHRRLSPNCSFVNGSSNNQPVPNVDTSSAFEWLASNFSFSHLQTDSDDSPQSYSLPNLTRDSVTEGTSSSPSSLPFFPDGASIPTLPFLSDLSTLEQEQLDSLPMDLVDGLANANLDSFTPSYSGLVNSGLSHSSQLFNPFTNGLGGPGEILVTDGESVGEEGQYPDPSMLQSHIADYLSPAPPPQPQPQKQDEVGNSVPQKLSFDDLGIIIQRPKRQDMATYPKRLETFDQWQGQQISQSKESIADAGFYYAGYADCCRCFYCGGGLKSWESDDVPWIEHARWFKDCPFVRMSKGKEFIDVVLSLARTNNSISMADVEAELRERLGSSQELTSDVADDVEADEDMDTELPGDDIEADAEHLESENACLKEPEMCKICLDSEVSVLYVPCGHLVTCATCAPTVKVCPVCRQKIHGQVRVQRTD